MVSPKRAILCVGPFFLFSIFFPSLLEAEENRPGLSLRETFYLYVRSIQNSDLKALFTTVTDSPKFFFLTSRGRLIDTREGYYKFHEEWFKEKEWEMPVDLLEAVEGKDYGYTNAIYHYKGKIPEGGMSSLDSYFTLIFHKEAGMWKAVADVCTPINRYQTEGNPEIKYTSDQVFLFDTIKNRRTVRKFKSAPIPEEHILKILDAARLAPTAGNQQPWKFLVIQNRKTLAALQKEALSWYLDLYRLKKRPAEAELTQATESVKKTLENVLSAPVYIAVLVDSRAQYADYVLYDGTLAAGNLMIAARALGYGTGFFTSFFPEDRMKEFFNIPDQYRLICLTPVGIPEEWPQAPPKKKLEDVVIFESFNERTNQPV
jgi:nitroreductase/ketosteroid isomerase-like protein